MYFRLFCWVNQFRLYDDKSFSVGGKHKITVRLRQPTSDEVAKQTAFEFVLPKSAVCIATGVWPVSRGLRAQFKEHATTTIVVDEAEPPQEAMTNFAWFSAEEHRQSEISAVLTDLLDAMNQVVDVIRWYLGFQIPHNPLFYRWCEWSWDGQTWGGLTGPFVWRRMGDYPTTLEGEAHADVVRLLGEGGIGALPRALWQEAWDEKQTNPRSAVILAIAAAEVGVKHAIVQLDPDAIQRVQQNDFPPIEQVLRECLPALLVQKFGTDVSAPRRTRSSLPWRRVLPRGTRSCTGCRGIGATKPPKSSSTSSRWNSCSGSCPISCGS